MEFEALIEKITQEVYANVQGRDTAEPGNSGSIELASYFEYTQINPSVKIDEIRHICEQAKQRKYACVCVPQWFTAFAKDMLTGTNVNVCTPVSLPGGDTSTPGKYAEVKQAVINGADEVEIPLNMTLLKQGNIDAAKRDIQEAMIPAAGKALVKVLIETAVLSEEKETQAVKMAIDSGADYIVISNILSAKPHESSYIGKISGLCKGRSKLKVMGNIKDNIKAREVISAGADRYGSSQAQTAGDV